MSEFVRASLNQTPQTCELDYLISGQYGEVNLCEMSVPPLQEGVDNSNSASKLVAVKKLQSNADEATKQDFIREIRIMSRLKHDNIVQVSNCLHLFHCYA